MKHLLLLSFFLMLGWLGAARAQVTGIAAYNDVGAVNDTDLFYDVTGFTGSNVGNDRRATALEMATYFDVWSKISGKPTTLAGYGITDAESASAAAAAFQPLSTNLTLWAAVAPSSYETISAATSSFQPLAANLTSWAAVVPTSYETVSAAAAGFQPISTNLTSWSGVIPSNYETTAAAAAQSTTGNAATASAVPFAGVTNRPGFYPTDLPNLKIWWSAGKLGLANGTAVPTLTDITGTGNTYTQATGSNQPTFLTNGINGCPALSFNGASDFLMSSFSLDTTWNHAFLAAYVIQSKSTSTQVLGGTTDNSFYSAISSGPANGSIYTNMGGSTLSNSGIIMQTAPMVVVFGYDGTTFRVFVNGVETVENATTTNINEATALSLGAFSNASYYFSGLMSEGLVYKYGPSVSDMRNLSRWLLDQYRFPSHQYVFEGDSLTFGAQGIGLPAAVLPSLGGILQSTASNIGISGMTLATGITLAPNRTYAGILNGYADKVVIVWLGTNDMDASGASGATTYASLASYCSALKAIGYKVVVVTTLPRSESGVNSGFETQRQIYNADILANWTTFADGVADLGDDLTIGAAGSSTNATYYYSDHIHLLTAGYAIAGPIVANAIKKVLKQPVFLTGTLASGTCTITTANIVTGSTFGAPTHLCTSPAYIGALTVAGWTAPASGSPGSVTIKSTNLSDNDTFQIPVN